MKILVAIKRVVDYTVQIRVKADQTGVETANVKMSMNPFDEIAMEEAIRLKEKGFAKEVVAVLIGPSSHQETLRSALAMGADKAILIETSEEIQALVAAKILKKIAEQESPQLIILGKQAIDSDNNQTGQMLAGLLHWPQGTFASKIEVEQNRTKVTREIDGGLETLVLTLPAVITTDLRLNEPRFLSLPNIMQAKRKPITIIPIHETGVTLKTNLQILKVTTPEKRQMGIKVDSVKELVKRLKDEVRVI